MHKKHSKNTELMAEALTDYIFNRSNQIVADLEQKKEFKETASEFNDLPKLKRLLDFYIINFWLASVICEEYYEHDDFQKICNDIEDAIYKSLESYEKSNQILGLTLKEFVKDQDELECFYREYPVSKETKVNFKVLLSSLITKRFFDYNSVLQLNLSQQVQKSALLFCKHVFGKKISESPDCMLVYAPVFALMLSSTRLAFSEYVVKLEEIIK